MAIGRMFFALIKFLMLAYPSNVPVQRRAAQRTVGWNRLLGCVAN